MREVYRDTVYGLTLVIGIVNTLLVMRGPRAADPPAVQDVANHPIGGLIVVAILFVIAGVLNAAPLLNRLIPNKKIEASDGSAEHDTPDYKELFVAENDARNKCQEQYAKATTERDQTKAELQRVIASIRKPSFPEHPLPDLRLRILELCTELQAFLGSYGDRVTTKRNPAERPEEHMFRLSSPELKELRVRFVGDYCRRYRKYVIDLRDELRQRSSKNDPALNQAISLAENEASPAEAVETTIKQLWEIALNVNC